MKYKESQIALPKIFDKDWKYYTGLAFFVLAMIMPVFALIIPAFKLPTGITTALIAITLAGGPELALILAAIFWGKKTLDHFKNKTFSFLRRIFKSIKPPQYVGKTQYYFWLFIWIFSGIPGIVDTYFPNLILPGQDEQRLYLAIMLDGLFFVSFFMLGGQFWDKIASIFRYDNPSDQA